MHGAPLPDAEPEYPMTAVAHETAPQPTGPWMPSGAYSVSLTTAGKTLSQPLTLKMDPRVTASTADLAMQLEFSKALFEMRVALQPIGKSYDALVAELAQAKERVGDKSVLDAIEALRKKLEEFADPAAIRAGQPLELDVLSKVKKLFGDLQAVDAAPTPQQQAAIPALQRAAQSTAEKWRSLPQMVADLNQQLERAGLEKIKFS